MMRRDTDGCPKCKRCGRRANDPIILVNKETLNDSTICKTCWFFEKQEAAGISVQDPTRPDITQEQFTKLPSIERYRAIPEIRSLKMLQWIRDNEKVKYVKARAASFVRRHLRKA